MIHEIDFLPAGYHQRQQLKQKKRWRQGLLVLFVSLIALGTLQQRQSQARLAANRDQLREQADNMAAQLESADGVRRQIRELDAKANLTALLRLRPSPTRVLKGLTDALPEFVTLKEVRSTHDKVAAKPTGPAKEKSNKPNQVPPAGATPDEADLAKLTEQRRETALYVSLVGVAPNDVAISGYLDALQRTKIFDEVQLLYTDQHVYRELPLRRFGMRLKVRNPQ